MVLRGDRVDAGGVRLTARLRDFNRAQIELWDRWLLLSRPWEEEWLHWGADGALHGSLPPPKGHGRHSVTISGWCPGLRTHGR
jgi:hypothetical protein